jgi:two-component sensor histidine kinase
VALVSRCSGSIAGDNVEALTLIANELITNAAKHAFKGRRSGEITLGYRAQGAGWTLWVHDDGAGLPGGSSAPSSSFGRLLVESLAARLNAKIIYASDGGTKVEIVCGIEC